MAPRPRLTMEDRVRAVVLHEEGNGCNKKHYSGDC